MADVRDSHGQHDLQIGQLALERGYITQDQLRGALAEQARDLEQGRPARTLPKIFIDKGYLTQRQVVSLNSGDEKTAPKRKLINKPFGRYTLLRELGRGGMGIVYEAYDTSVERKVALKVMIPHPDAEPEEAKTEEERFIRETKLTARLPNHANIVSVYDGGVIERRRYITMEYIEGQRFDTWRKTSHTTTKQQIAVLRDVIRAVHHAHESKIFHRDLKPANILVDTDNQPRVTDFGLAKIADDNSRATLTASGMVIGTPVYMSPEQAKGRRDIDYRTDIYSLGVMLYEVLTNRVPFDGAQAIAILHKHVHERALLPSHCVRGIDQGIENICMKALEKKPAMRYQKAKDLADDITRWLNGDFVRTPEPTRRRVAHAPKKSFAWIYGLAAALIIGILAIVALTSNSRPDVASNPKVGPAPKPGPKNPRTPVRKPPPKHPGLAALKAAREHGDKTTADVIAKLKLYDSAKWNLADQPELDGAQKERNALSEKLQQMFAEEFQEALKDIVPPITREEYQTALDRLEKTKRRYAQPAWTRLVENETFTLQRDIKKQYDLLKHKAIKAKLDGSDKEVKTHVDRVGKWGITLYINHLRNHLSGIETPDPPEPAPPVAAINPSSVNRGNASTNPQITGLIAHWKLDETYGENVKDSSGNRNNGKLKQGAKWTKGRIGGAASFDGIDDYIDLPHTRLLNTVQQNSYTLSAWFSPDGIPRKKSKPADSQEYGIIIKRGNHLGLSYTHDQKFRMDHWLSITNGVAVGSVNKYPPGRFYHVAGVVNKEAGTTTIYVNGKRDGVTKWPANSPTKDYGTIRWRIGHGNPDGVNWTWPAKGVIDEVRIYGRALSEIEISGLAGTGPLAGAKEFRGHYYKYFDKRVTWHKARDLCKEIGGHLVTINSPEENAFVENLIPSMGIWLGLTDEDTEGKWDTWITGEPVTYKNWDPSQPNGVTPGQDYAATHENKAHRWFDNEARNSRMFVCEWGTETGSSGTSQPRGNPSTEGINLLKHVKLPGAIVNGGWSNLDGALAANGTFAVLELPYEPGEEYDFRVRFSMKKAGRKKYQVAQIFSHNGKQYCWSTMHYDGTGTVSGFSGGTPKAANRTHPPLENDRIYTTTIKIRKNRVLAYRNGKLLVSYTTDYNDLSTDPKLKVRNPKLLGIGSNMAQTTFHSVEVVEKTGKGKLIEGSVIPVAGAGGLTGEYFNLGKGKFEGKPTFTRIDPEIDFQWHDGSPDPRIIPESFTVRWSGRIRAPTTDTYTFITKTDDGVRLWVDGKLVIDHWASAFTASGAIHLRGGKLYDIKMEYCEHGGGAQAHLSWKTPSIKTQIIPRNVLYPAPQNEREKTKIPSSSKRMALLREIKRQYKLPRTTTARRELAKELIKKADAIEGNSDERYALLQHAKEVSASTADLGAAFAAAEQLASYYQINVLEEKKSAIEKARSVPRIPEVARSFVRSCMGFMDECVEADDYKLAKYALSNASRLSKVAQDKPLSDRVKEASKTVVLLERAYSRINRYLEKVKSTPKDPKANLEVAKYYAFQKQDWEKGTAHLALAVGTDYEEVGKVEANKPVTYEDVRLAGTAWNKLQSKLRGSDKEGAKQRAIHWYYKARELAPENERSRWEEGISKLQGAQQLPRNGLVFWIEPGRGKTPYAEVLTNLTPKINQKPVTSGNPVPPSFELTEVWYPRSAKVKGVGPDGTVVVWVKTDVKDRNQALVERGPGYLQDFLLRVGNNNKFVAQIKTPPSFTSLFSKRTVVPGEWVCGMMTWNARELSVYADGVKEGTKPLNGPSVFDQDIIRLGKSTFDDGFLKGQIGLVLVYDRQVTDKEAWAIYDLYRKRFR